MNYDSLQKNWNFSKEPHTQQITYFISTNYTPQCNINLSQPFSVLFEICLIIRSVVLECFLLNIYRILDLFFSWSFWLAFSRRAGAAFDFRGAFLPTCIFPSLCRFWTCKFSELLKFVKWEIWLSFTFCLICPFFAIFWIGGDYSCTWAWGIDSGVIWGHVHRHLCRLAYLRLLVNASSKLQHTEEEYGNI